MSDAVGGRRGVYSIGAVARMLAVPVATIRNWEERYATVVPQRSAGGQRLYSQDEVKQLRYVAAQIEAGLSAADAHRMLAEQATGGPLAVNDERGDHERPLVLIAERDPAAAELARAVLRREGYEVEPVYEVDDVEQLWRERRPRLAIVELMISGGRGTDLCRRLKQHDGGAVLAISGLAARDEALAAGADAFLEKPVDPLELVATVRSLLANASREA